MPELHGYHADIFPPDVRSPPPVEAAPIAEGGDGVADLDPNSDITQSPFPEAPGVALDSEDSAGMPESITE